MRTELSQRCRYSINIRMGFQFNLAIIEVKKKKKRKEPKRTHAHAHQRQEGSTSLDPHTLSLIVGRPLSLYHSLSLSLYNLFFLLLMFDLYRFGFVFYFHFQKIFPSFFLRTNKVNRTK